MADTKQKSASTDAKPKASPPTTTPTATTTTTSPAPSANATVFTPASASTSTTITTGEDPLETRWSFWYDKKLSREAATAAGFTNYAQNLQKVGSFDSIQGFWKHYAYIQSPDQIPRDHNLYLFRNDDIPAWETYPQGGAWIIKVRKGNGVINRLWEELCFACVGEWFEDPDVVGVTLATRVKDDNISVWNRGPGMNARIGERLKDLLNLDESTQVEFKPFSNAIHDNSSFRNAKAFTYAPTL